MKIKVREGVIYAICKREGISRDELARRMGVSTATAYRIDSGQTDPSPAFIASFMNVTEKPFEELFEIVTEAVPA